MKATHREPEIVTRNGKPVSVIVPIKEYQELLERAEDAEDAGQVYEGLSDKDIDEVESIALNRNGFFHDRPTS